MEQLFISLMNEVMKSGLVTYSLHIWQLNMPNSSSQERVRQYNVITKLILQVMAIYQGLNMPRITSKNECLHIWYNCGPLSSNPTTGSVNIQSLFCNKINH